MSDHQKITQAVVSPLAAPVENQGTEKFALFMEDGTNLIDALADPAYTPAETTDWTGADPTTLADAIDRIAAALGPIA